MSEKENSWEHPCPKCEKITIHNSHKRCMECNQSNSAIIKIRKHLEEKQESYRKMGVVDS